jgi:glycosyltransferase involved in cell wall biosynthesis
MLRAAGVATISGARAIETELVENGSACRFIILSRPATALRFMFAVRAAAPQAMVVYDTVDLHWLRFEREAALVDDADSLRESGRIKQEELFAAESADLILTVTDTEREVLLRELPSARVAVLPNIHPSVQGESRCDGRNGLLFVGGFLHRPNVDAMQYFVSDVLPLVHRRRPDLRLFIVGSEMPEAIRALRSDLVEPVGHVSDLSPHFQARRLFVAPLRYGAGMKGKVGQSLSAGLPVVTTTVGADGMALRDEEHALIADSPQEFADAIERAYADDVLWRRLSDRGRAHVRTHFSDEAARARLEQLFPSTGVVE